MTQADVVMITGGATGIGLAIAREALARGALVSTCGRRLDSPARLATLGLDPHRVLAVRADISREDEVENWFRTTVNRWGSADVVVNNAAISDARLLVTSDAVDWDRVIANNATGAFLVARQAVRAFLKRKAGVLVSIGSLAQYGSPANAAYAVSKAALVGLTRAIAQRHRSSGIRAHLVVGGFVDTELTRDLPETTRRWLVETCPQRRQAQAREVATAVLDLAGPAGAALNGRSVHVTGGLTGIPG